MLVYQAKSGTEQSRVCELLEKLNCSYQITHGSLDIEILGANKAAAAPDLLTALQEIAETCKAGVIERRETGKPTWNVLEYMQAVACAATTRAEKE